MRGWTGTDHRIPELEEEESRILFDYIGQAIAEFQSTLVAADAPIDQFACAAVRG